MLRVAEIVQLGCGGCGGDAVEASYRAGVLGGEAVASWTRIDSAAEREGEGIKAVWGFLDESRSTRFVRGEVGRSPKPKSNK